MRSSTLDTSAHKYNFGIFGWAGRQPRGNSDPCKCVSCHFVFTATGERRPGGCEILEAELSQEQMGGGEPEAFFTMEDIRRARLPLRRSKTAWMGELVAKMTQNIDAMD